jgi:hypothetical protein
MDIKKASILRALPLAKVEALEKLEQYMNSD